MQLVDDNNILGIKLDLFFVFCKWYYFFLNFLGCFTNYNNLIKIYVKS